VGLPWGLTIILEENIMSYLFTAYSIIWVVLFLYIFSIFKRQKKLSDEIRSLKQMIEEKNFSKGV